MGIILIGSVLILVTPDTAGYRLPSAVELISLVIKNEVVFVKARHDILKTKKSTGRAVESEVFLVADGTSYRNLRHHGVVYLTHTRILEKRPVVLVS